MSAFGDTQMGRWKSARIRFELPIRFFVKYYCQNTQNCASFNKTSCSDTGEDPVEQLSLEGERHMTKLNAIKLAAVLGTTSVSALTVAAPVHAQSEAAREYRIEAQSLAKALVELSKQGDVVVTAPARLTRGKMARSVSGNYTARQALGILLAGTDLTVRSKLGGSFVIERGKREAGNARIGIADKNSLAAMRSPGAGEAIAENAVDHGESEEIVVTGTNIRNGNPVGSPVRMYSRGEIARSGASTTAQVMEAIPQNFGGIGEDTATLFVPGDGRSNANSSQGTGVNLRGLGSDSTLLLVNGHRFTQTGAGDFIDLTQIPISAIERIDVVTDGASAIYGSDAVAGVVNVILARNFDGLELRSRYGSVTEGDFSRFSAGITGGQTWSTGSILGSYDYSKQTNLSRADRPFVGPPVADVIPEKRADNFLLTGRQQIGAITAGLDVLYSNTKNNFLASNSTAATAVPNDRRTNKNTNLNVALDIDIPIGSWVASLGGVYSRASIDADRRNDITGAPGVERKFLNDLTSINAKVGGTLFELPAGALRVTVGAGYRNETFFSNAVLGTVQLLEQNGVRNVTSLFAEALVPVLGDESGIGKVDLSIAGRYEHYSDFGSTFNPKFGASWSVFDGFRLRGTYGTSFRAPSFNQIDTSFNSAVLAFIPDPRTGGQALAFFLTGNSDEFEPERSHSFNIGVDYQVPVAPGIRLSLDYFTAELSGKFQTPASPAASVLTNEVAFQSIIMRNPSSAQLTAAIANAGPFGIFNSASGSNPLSATVLVDNRAQNIGVTKISGLDASVRAHFQGLGGIWDLTADATHLIRFERQITPDSPALDVAGTLFNPPKWRFRGTAGATFGRVQAGFTVTHSPRYQNNLATPVAEISSWTLMDASVALHTGETSSAFLRNFTIRLSAQNLFDRNPPFVASTGSASVFSVGYDAANANPIGRYVSIEVTKRF
jgi:iron complex outermembrane recepter protein